MHEVQSTSEDMLWLRGTFEFATTFSYRLPGASSQFAIGVPVPSPAAVKLALVAAAIHEEGSPDAGVPVLEAVRNSAIWFGVPRRIVRFRAFIKRLKPAKEAKGLQESTGARDYFLLDSPLEIYISVSPVWSARLQQLLARIRRFGTSDSLCCCCDVSETEPPSEYCAVPLEFFSKELAQALHERILVSLLDLQPTVTFDDVDPFREGTRRGDPFRRVPYALPMRVTKSGVNWTLMERTGG